MALSVASTSRPTFEIEGWQAEMISLMPKKPAQYAERLFRRGIDLADSLRRGINPLSDQKPEFIGLACDMLLQGGFTKLELKTRMLSYFTHWDDRTAEGQVSVVFALLWGLGAIKSNEGRYQIKEST